MKRDIKAGDGSQSSPRLCCIVLLTNANGDDYISPFVVNKQPQNSGVVKFCSIYGTSLRNIAERKLTTELTVIELVLIPENLTQEFLPICPSFGTTTGDTTVGTLRDGGLAHFPNPRNRTNQAKSREKEVEIEMNGHWGLLYCISPLPLKVHPHPHVPIIHTLFARSKALPWVC